MPNNDSTEWLTAAELAAELDVHEETVRAWARLGRIEVRPLPRRGRRYRRPAFDVRESAQPAEVA